MTYIGALLVIFAAFTVWRVYCSYLFEESNMLRAFLHAICDYRDNMKCYLKSPKEWADHYSEDIPTEFISAVRNGEGLLKAYLKTEGRGYLPKDIDCALEECFSHLGEGYLETELVITEAAIDKLTAEEKLLYGELGKKKKTVGALIGAFAVGLIILII